MQGADAGVHEWLTEHCHQESRLGEAGMASSASAVPGGTRVKEIRPVEESHRNTARRPFCAEVY